jgi:hypothetical protein
MASRPSGKRTTAVKVSRGRARFGPSARDLVIVSRTLSDLAEFLERRQESSGRGRVILDRRVGERRRTAHAVSDDRRQSDRRQEPSQPTEALMRVLGFTVVPAGRPPSGSSGRRAGARPSRAARPANGSRPVARHRARRRRS